MLSRSVLYRNNRGRGKGREWKVVPDFLQPDSAASGSKLPFILSSKVWIRIMSQAAVLCFYGIITHNSANQKF